MTKSTITRERLAKIKSWRETYGAGSNVMLPAEEAEELARIALDAMDSEPVAYTDERNLGYIDRGRETAYLWGKQNSEASDVALYRHAQPAPEYPETLPCPVLLEPGMRFGKGVKTRLVLEAIQRRAEHHAELEAMAPEERAEYDANIEAFKAMFPLPAPVVPNGLRLALSNAGIAAPESDEMLAATCEKHIQALVTWVKDRKPFQSAPVVPSFEEWLSAANLKPLGWVKDAMREACDACRADMLADAPHDTPAMNSVQSVVTAHGKWIPVSERMPPSRHEVLVGRWWGEKPRWCCKWATYIPGHPDAQSSGWLIPGGSWTPTHWMELPAAPQEVKGE